MVAPLVRENKDPMVENSPSQVRKSRNTAQSLIIEQLVSVVYFIIYCYTAHHAESLWKLGGQRGATQGTRNDNTRFRCYVFDLDTQDVTEEILIATC
jgi:hypothetical protein